MSKDIKRLMIDSIQQAITGHSDFIVVDVSQVSGASINRIRIELAERGVKLLSIKNAVALRALSGFNFGHVPLPLKGPSALAFGSGDIVSVIKDLIECEKNDKRFILLSGIVDGDLLDRSGVDSLGKSLGKRGLLMELSSLMLSVGRSIASSVVSYGVLASQIDRLQASPAATE